jgi:hypothetical protein
LEKVSEDGNHEDETILPSTNIITQMIKNRPFVDKRMQFRQTVKKFPQINYQKTVYEHNIRAKSKASDDPLSNLQSKMVNLKSEVHMPGVDHHRGKSIDYINSKHKQIYQSSKLNSIIETLSQLNLPKVDEEASVNSACPPKTSLS